MGFRPYDQILKIDDEPIETWSEVQEIIESSPDQKLSFNLNRGGKEVLVRAKPLSSENDNVFSTAQRIGKIKGLNAYLHIPVIGVIPHGNMARLGFKTGDHIIEINGQPITWFKEIEPRILEELFKGKGQVSLKLKRYPDFRKKEVFKDLSLSLNKESLRGEKLDIFIPETVIAEVEEESPAALGGLQRLDQIKSINGHPIFSFNDIVTHISAYKQGNPPLKIKVLRGTREKSFEIIPQMNQLEGGFWTDPTAFHRGGPSHSVCLSPNLYMEIHKFFPVGETLHPTNIGIGQRSPCSVFSASYRLESPLKM